ncbi:MAG: UDP-N-acetylglucosamine 2-epimerase, partial [Bacteroidia bacterium]|nr:UDP-N-acetylglucosamine 2-epimerase [Bacteroidia bacterium]
SIDNPKIYHCGDVMFDNSLHFSEIAEKKSGILDQLELTKNDFVLATIHRNNNTDEPERLHAIFSALDKITKQYKIKIVLPLHPRTAKLLSQNLNAELYSSIKTNKQIVITEPVSFLEMIALEKNAQLILTDSGGVQKEAFFFEKPCIILRSETEWTELVDCNAAIIADADETKIIDTFNYFTKNRPASFLKLFGDGKAAQFICTEITKHIS